MPGTRRIIHVLLVVAVAGLGFAAYVAVGPPAAAKAPTTTATVRRGVVLSSVSATGNVSPLTQLAVDFQNSGIVSEIDVAVGQHVTAGQVLAKVQSQTQVDAFRVAEVNLITAQKRLAEAESPTAATVAQDQATLTSSQAALSSAQAGVTNSKQAATMDVGTFQNAVTQAQDAVANAQANATQDATVQQTAVGQAESKLASDQTTAAAQLNADQAQLTADQQKGVTDQAAVTAALNALATCNSSPPPAGCTSEQNAVTAAQAAVASDPAKVASDQVKVASDGTIVASDQNAVTNAQNSLQSAELKDQQAIQSAQNGLTNAQNSQQTGLLKDQQAITNAQNQVLSAQASLTSTKAGNAAKEITDPATLVSDQASLMTSQQQLDSAEQAVANTVLSAPVAGTVGAINGVVGEAATGSLSGSSSSGSSSSSTGSAGAASSGFISLTDLSTLQVVAGFSETDASKISVGQPATVSFNALTTITLQGKVSQLNINSVTVSNVVTYNLVVSILGAPSTLKPGMTANVSVTTAEKDNVLELPSSAITATGNTAVVQVLQPDGKTIVTKSITIGMRGDTNDEITSGLNNGDKVVVSLAGARSSALSTTARTALGGLGGVGGGLGGAVRIGGGG
jgi:multidrug efflux pump subunit AcrA (membrane-fusion protein)